MTLFVNSSQFYYLYHSVMSVCAMGLGKPRPRYFKVYTSIHLDGKSMTGSQNEFDTESVSVTDSELELTMD